MKGLLSATHFSRAVPMPSQLPLLLSIALAIDSIMATDLSQAWSTVMSPPPPAPPPLSLHPAASAIAITDPIVITRSRFILVRALCLWFLARRSRRSETRGVAIVAIHPVECKVWGIARLHPG